MQELDEANAKEQASGREHLNAVQEQIGRAGSGDGTGKESIS